MHTRGCSPEREPLLEPGIPGFGFGDADELNDEQLLNMFMDVDTLTTHTVPALPLPPPPALEVRLAWGWAKAWVGFKVQDDAHQGGWEAVVPPALTGTCGAQAGTTKKLPNSPDAHRARFLL